MKNIRVLCCVLLLLTSFVYAQTVVPDDVYKKADVAMETSAGSTLKGFLSQYAQTRWYPRLEEYIVKRARQFVVEDKLDLAKTVLLALIDNNLDNSAAVNLYQSVQSVIAKRDEQVRKDAEKAAVESYKQTENEAKVKQDLSKNYKTVTNTATGKKVYLDQDFNTHYSSWTWDVMIGLGNLNYITEPDTDSLKYGFSVGGSTFYHGDTITAGFDLDSSLSLLAISGDTAVNLTGSLVSSLSATQMSKHITFRLGGGTFGWNFGSDSVSPVLFSTPIIGFGIRDVAFGEAGYIECAFDYYIGHIFTDTLDMALGTHLLLTLTLVEMQDFDIFFRMGIKDTLLLFTSGPRNDMRILMSFGAGNYD